MKCVSLVCRMIEFPIYLRLFQVSRPLYEGLFLNEHHKRQLRDEFGRKNKHSVPCSISKHLLLGNLRDDSCYCFRSWAMDIWTTLGWGYLHSGWMSVPNQESSGKFISMQYYSTQFLFPWAKLNFFFACIQFSVEYSGGTWLLVPWKRWRVSKTSGRNPVFTKRPRGKTSDSRGNKSLILPSLRTNY